MIDDVEVQFTRGCGRCARFDTADCATRRWSDGLHAPRQLCREAGLAETAKWGHPCCMHAGRNQVIQLASAKAETTRVARIIRFRPRILAGKGALER